MNCRKYMLPTRCSSISTEWFSWFIIFRDEMTEALDPVEDNPEFKNGVGAEQKPAVPCESGLCRFYLIYIF